LKILFPVLLKCATCNITDNVSSIGIIAIITNNKGIFKYKAIAATAPPSIKDPVSPIITFDGYKLNNKNPKHAPDKALPNKVTSFISNIIAITVKHVNIIVVTLLDKPSTPSVKLIAFVLSLSLLNYVHSNNTEN